MLDDERGGNAAQIKPLAARENRRQNLLRVGRREHELHVRGRLFQRLEQRVERRRREHVDFVNDVDFERRIGRRVFAGLAQLAHLLDAVVARAVNFQHVERPALGDFNATRVLVVEINFRAAGAVQAFGKDAGDGGLAGAARAAEQIGVRDALLLDGVGERLGDVFLADHVGETLRAVFSGYDLIGHHRITIYDLRFTSFALERQLHRQIVKSQTRKLRNARVTTADVEQTTVAAFRPWRGS